jgi:hypothetical protein
MLVIGWPIRCACKDGRRGGQPTGGKEPQFLTDIEVGVELSGSGIRRKGHIRRG